MLNTRTKNELLGVALWLTRFLGAERKRYFNAVVRKDRYQRCSHRLMLGLVPVYRSLNALLRQAGAASNFGKAPERLVQLLVKDYILHPRVPEQHPVWDLPVSGKLIREFATKGPGQATDWLMRAEPHKEDGLLTIMHIEGTTLGELRANYLAAVQRHQLNEDDQLKNILKRVKSLLSEKEYTLLTRRMLPNVSFAQAATGL